VTFWTEADVSL
jgi:large subunit ribosomal protein L7Ae